MAWAERHRLHRLKCKRPECGQMFEAYRKTQRFCSNSCGIKGRGKEWWAVHQAKITAIRQAKGYSRFIQRMLAAGLTDAQIAVVRKEMLMVRANAHSAGKRRGWAEACGEPDDTRWSKARREA